MQHSKYILLSLLCILCLRVSAQQISSVRGTVADEYGPIVGVAVCEMDANNRIIENTVTDVNGNFSMHITNSKDRLRFSYVGYKTQWSPIDRTEYNITMKSENVIKEVSVTAKRRLNSGGLAIPEREISYSTQTISTKEFEGLGMNTIDEALQGRISGLDIVAVSGNLGSGTTMRLRGATTVSSLTSSNPLIVVNGNVWNVDMSNFDVNSANDEQFAQLLNINPEDIASITVLKDAAATAIYGSQGANGVIELTTKRGSRGKPRVSYSLRLTGTYQPQGYHMLSGDDYTMLLKESYFNPQQSSTASDIPEINYDPTFSEYEEYNNNTNWHDAVTQWGLRQNHFVSVTGGGEKATFRVSAGFDNETGSVIKQKLNRFSTRVALDYYVSERIKIATNFSLTYTKNKKNYDDLLAIAQNKMPNMSIYEQDANGNDTPHYYEMLQSASSVFNGDGNQKRLVNPVASANLAKNNENTYDITPELQINYKLLGVDDDHWRLDYEGRVYMNIFHDYINKFYPQELVTVNWKDGVNTSSAYSSSSVAFNTKQTLTLTPHFNNPDHSLMMLGRMELISGTSNSQTTNGRGLPSGGITKPDAGGIIKDLGSGYSDWRSLYFTFSTHYSYKSRYSADFSLRADGTSKFGPSKRWGYFPAVSFRWNISDEPFMKATRSWLSMLSLRPSWGRVGNQPSDNYLYENKFAKSDSYIDMNAMSPTNLRLNDLRWETVSTYDVGMDLGFLNDRLRLTLEWYRSTTKDMLMSNVRIPSNTGYLTLATDNVGSMRNTGWEINLTTNRLYERGKFYVDVNASFGNNRNEILSMNESVLNSLNTQFGYQNRDVLQRVQLHNPFGAIYGFRYKGVYEYKYSTFCNMSTEEQKAFLAAGHTAPVALAADGTVIYDDKGIPIRMVYNYSNDGTGTNYNFTGGDAIYEDVNHDGNINELDIVYLGSSLPKLTGGFGFTFNYSGWRLNTQFTYRVGNKILNLARLDAESMISNNNQSQAVNYRWRKEGDQTSIPRAMYGATSNYNTLVSDRFVEDGSFLRLNYIQLSYGLKTKLLKRIGLSGLRFYMSANNLFCLTKYQGVDPEVSYGSYGAATDTGQTPRARSYTLGITVDF